MLGVMQGRLSPPVEGRFQFFPRDTWAQEIKNASTIGLDSIEWIYDTYGDGANPIETDLGIDGMRSLCDEYGVLVNSVCADWFMEELLVGVDVQAAQHARERLEWLISRVALIGVSRIVLPFVDASALSSEALKDEAVNVLIEVLPLAHRAGVELHLETSLGPEDFASLLHRIDDPFVKVNYDIGNSASLGYEPRAEFEAYGDRIGSVHIKDRVLGGSTVSLGTGNANFDAVFEQLSKVQYQGAFILQAARGVPGDEVAHVAGLVTQARAFIASMSSESSR